MALASWTNAQIVDQLGSGYYWTGSTITYTFPVSSAGIYFPSGQGPGLYTLTTYQQSVARIALQLWNDLIARSMTEVAPGTTPYKSNIEFGMSTALAEGSYAYALFPTIGSVWFSNNSSGTNNLVSPTIGRHGFVTYVHEIGHSLGLDHMGSYNGDAGSGPSCFQDSVVYSVMSYYGPAGPLRGEGQVAWADWVGSDGILYSPQTPMLNDVMAIQAIYGRDLATRTGDTVYGFNSNITDTLSKIFNFSQNLHPILTIYDAGGNDTLDLSGWNTNSIINIAAGSSSSCNSMTDNIWIAYNTTIENAIGGAGDDTIFGNAASNRLSGLGGNDVITGGAGNDFIDGGAGSDRVVFTADISQCSITKDGIYFNISTPSEGIDQICNVEYFTFNNITYAAASLVTDVDVTAPTVSSIVYGANDGTLKAGETVTLLATLSEAVNVTGTPTLALANGGTASYTSGSGTSTLIFSYTVGAGQNTADLATAGSAAFSGTIADLAGNAVVAAGFNGVNPAGTLAVDTVAPTVSAFSPGDGSTGVALSSNIALTFAEAIRAGSGTITIRTGSSTGTIFESFDVATSSRISLSGATLTIDPTNSLSASTSYYVVVPSGAVLDLAGNAYAGADSYDFATASSASVITGTADADNLVGTAGVDTIRGLAGDDVITGAGGVDVLDGGEGSDIYIVAAPGDHSAAEFGDTGVSGIDEVRFSSVSSGATLTLYAGDTGIERVVIGTGAAAAAVSSGTAAVNVDAAALNYGIILVGNAGANILTGGSGDDILQGGAGNDTLIGGGGFDYADYSASTKAITADLTITAAQNTGGAGTDTLGGIEGLIGGSTGDTLRGDAGGNVLYGRGGNDVLTGGGGADWFVFDTQPNSSSNKDTITDFVSGTDLIVLTQAIYAGLELGDLAPDAFWSAAGATRAHDASDRLIYNTTTGALYFDPDGTGKVAAVQIALFGVTTHPTLAYTDFKVI